MKIIAADVWDALELSAFAAGGVGAGGYVDENSDSPWIDAPFCIAAHIRFLTDDLAERDRFRDVVSDGSHAVPGCAGPNVTGPNDDAVRAINHRKGKFGAAQRDRVSWEEYIAERGWVREGAA